MGTFEHIISVSVIFNNALLHHLLAMTFIDLKNSFKSVLHSYIDDILEHISLPVEFHSYISSLYLELVGFIETKEWKTDPFPISRGGVFQGDTLSPLIFLVAFNPIIKGTQSLIFSGSCLLLPPPLTPGFSQKRFLCIHPLE